MRYSARAAMRFIVTASSPVGGGAERVGELVTRSGEHLPTPRAALLTSSGSVAHVTREVLSLACAEPQLLLCPLSTCVHMEAGVRALGRGIAGFCASRPKDAWLVTADDASVKTPAGHHVRGSIPLWTRHGKLLVHPDRYMDLMELMAPDAYVALADTRADPTSPRKRLLNSVTRTSAALDVCLQRHSTSQTLTSDTSILGAVVGWGCEDLVQRSVEHVSARSERLLGVTLAGVAAPHASAVASPQQLPAELPHALRELDGRLVRAVCGRWSPACVLYLVSLGCDVFDASAAQRLADDGRALVFPYADGQLDDEEAQLILDMDDTRWSADMRPLVEGCECVACARHTRAYVHHLRRTRELLAPVLLTLHNMHHYDAFFCEVRRQIAAGTFPRYATGVARHHARYVAQHPQADAQTDPQTRNNAAHHLQADAQTDTQADPQTRNNAAHHPQADAQTDTQADPQTRNNAAQHTQTDKQADMQREAQTDAQTHKNAAQHTQADTQPRKNAAATENSITS